MFLHHLRSPAVRSATPVNHMSRSAMDNTTACGTYSTEYLFKINTHPPEDLDLNCLCRAVYLKGTPDITGPGVSTKIPPPCK